MKKLIGIKSSIDKQQLKNKYIKDLPLLELYLTDKDFKEKGKIHTQIKWILKEFKEIKLMLHVPVLTDIKETLHLDNKLAIPYILKLYKLCNEFKEILGIVVHPEPTKTKVNKQILDNNIQTLKKNNPEIFKYLYFENCIKELTKRKEDFLSFIEKYQLKNVCFDFAHYSAYHSEEEFFELLKYLSKNYNLYCHISDNNFNSHEPIPKNIGKGEINFKKYKEYINFGIIETISEDENIGNEIKEDYKKLFLIFTNK